jgi:hypothetical protein
MTKRRFPNPNKATSYEVGYCRPPKKTQFKKGQSGNPKGRPEGSTASNADVNYERLKELILEESYRKITVRDGERSVEMPVIQASIRSLTLNAAKGDTRAQKRLMDILARIENERQARRLEELREAIEYKVAAEYELERRKKLGIEGPDLIPHPDDIRIDFVNNTFRINGPMCKEEIPFWDNLRQLKRDTLQEIAELQRRKEEDGDPDGALADELERAYRLKNMIRTKWPD